MGRRFAPFETAVHFTGTKSRTEIQKLIDEFYLKAIETALAESALSARQRCGIIDRIAAYHESQARRNT